MDAAFNPPKPNGSVHASVVQPDGRIIIAGNFTQAHSEGRVRVARLLPNGDLDSAFNPGIGPNGAVHSLALQPDGKVLICGAFTQVSGTPRNMYARLNENGTLDTDYAAAQPVLATGSAQQILSLPNGKALLAGPSMVYFSFSPLVSRGNFIRLNTNGTCDTSFPELPLVSSGVFAGAVTPTGNYLVGGWFHTSDGSARTNLIQVTPAGAIDSTFASNPFAGGPGIGWVRNIRTMADGRIVFTHTQGGTTNWIVRLNGNGAPDYSFGHPHADQAILSAAVQPDGQVWIAGDFEKVNGIQSLKVARLTASGALDNSFDPGTGTGTSVFSMILQPDGKLLMGGAFNGYNGFYFGPFVRLLGDLTAGEPRLVGTTFFLTVATALNKSYTLEYKNAWSDPAWTVRPAVAGTGGELVLSDPTATNASRIYRVVEN